jgi:hypothetical protein
MPIRTTNAIILGETAHARINRRVLAIGDSQTTDQSTPQMIKGYYADARFRFGAIFTLTGSGGPLNDGMGVFGAPPTGATMTMRDPGNLLVSPDDSYAQPLPLALAQFVYGQNTPNFSGFANNFEYYLPAVSGFGGVGDRVRLDNIVLRTPNSIDGGINPGYEHTANAVGSGGNASQSALTVTLAGLRSNGGAIPHGSVGVVSGPHAVITPPSGTFQRLSVSSWNYANVDETGRTFNLWRQCLRRVDASGNWLASRFAFLYGGGGGYKVEDHLPQGEPGQTYWWSDAAMQPVINWYQPEIIKINIGSNNGFSASNASEAAAYKAKLERLVTRMRNLAPTAKIMLVDPWLTFLAVNMASYSYAGDTTIRTRYEKIWEIHQQLQDADPAFVMRLPLGSAIIERLGSPGPSSWVQTHLRDQIHTSNTGATGADSFTDIETDLTEAGDFVPDPVSGSVVGGAVAAAVAA